MFLNEVDIFHGFEGVAGGVPFGMNPFGDLVDGQHFFACKNFSYLLHGFGGGFPHISFVVQIYLNMTSVYLRVC